MRITKALFIAGAAFIATPLAAQATNEAYPVDNTAAANDVAATAGNDLGATTPTDAAALPGDQNAALPPDATTTVVDTTGTAPPADNDGGGFPWGVLGLLGLLGLIPRLRR